MNTRPRMLNEILDPAETTPLGPMTYHTSTGERLDFLWTGVDPCLLIDVGGPSGHRHPGTARTLVLDVAGRNALMARDLPADEALAHLTREAAPLEDVAVAADPDKPVPPVKVLTADEENMIQTGPEATIFNSPGLLEKMKKALETSKFCEKFGTDTLMKTQFMELPDLGDPKLTLRKKLLSHDILSCVSTGELLLAKSTLQLFDAQFDLGPGGRIVIDDYETDVELFRQAVATEVRKASKFEFGLGLSLFPDLGADDPKPTSAPQEVKGGDPAFEKGKPKAGPALAGIGFNGGLLKQYYKATMSATFRFKLVHRVRTRLVIEVKKPSA